MIEFVSLALEIEPPPPQPCPLPLGVTSQCFLSLWPFTWLFLSPSLCPAVYFMGQRSLAEPFAGLLELLGLTCSSVILLHCDLTACAEAVSHRVQEPRRNQDSECPRGNAVSLFATAPDSTRLQTK